MMTRSHGPSRGTVRTFLLAAAVALSAAIGAAPARGQGSGATGAIEGVVTDPNGAVIIDALATVTHKETGVERTATSDAEGRYRFTLLPPGPYTLRVTSPGFAEWESDQIEISFGQSINLPVQLALAGVGYVAGLGDETNQPLIDTTRTALSTTVENRMVEHLPLTGRNWDDLISLVPGVQADRYQEGTTVNGQRLATTNVLLDGDDNTSLFGDGSGRATSRQPISVEAVQELQAITNGAAAEFGRSSGGIVNIVSKSGTNEFGGSAYLYFKNEALASDNPGEVKAGIPRKDFRRLQPGATFGGPIKQKRAFFFVSYDRLDDESRRANRIDPRLAQIFAQRFGGPAEEGLIERADKNDSAFGRVDVNSDRLNLTARYGYGRYALENGSFDVPTWGRSANGRQEGRTNLVYGNLSYAPRPTLLNEFRPQYSRESNAGLYEGPDIPDVSIGGTDPLTGEPTSYRFGRPFFLPNSSSSARLQLSDNFSAQLGGHSFKAGFGFARARGRQTYPAFARGRYIFASVEAFEAYLDDPRNFGGLLYFSQFVAAGGRSVDEAATQEFAQVEPAFFAQDSWRATAKLTLNYGLRYDAQIQPQPITPLAERRYAQFIGRPGFPSDGSIPSDKGGWQPRFGVAWDPKGDAKTVVRANMGIYYARVTGFVISGARNTDGTVGYSITTCCGHDFLPSPPPGLGAFTQTAGAPPFNPGVRVFASDFRNPRTLQWSAGVEREVARSLSAKFEFIYANSVHLTRFVNRNAPAFVGHFAPDGRRLFDGPRPFARPDGSGIGDLITAESSGHSLYRAFNFEAARRFRGGVGFGANYVLSWSYSDADETSPYLLAYADLLDLRPEYSYSDFDQRHRFSAYGTVELPYGFQLDATFQARSAQPDTFFLPNDANGDGNAFDRPYSAGRDVGRNTTRKRNRRSSVSVRATRTTRFGERRRGELFFEIGNTFNSTNPLPFSNPLLLNFDTTVRSGFDDPRQAQFGVKFIF
jgi:hypothetical protein